MLLVYNYEKIQEILDLHMQGKLITLVITKPENQYLMNYTRIEDYSEDTVNKLNGILNDPDFLKKRMSLTEILNKFVKNEKADNLIQFSLDYSVLRELPGFDKATLNYAIATKTTLPDEEDSDLINPFPALKKYVREKACGNYELTDIFDKPQGAGKNKKSIPLTVSEVIERLEKALS